MRTRLLVFSESAHSPGMLFVSPRAECGPHKERTRNFSTEIEMLMFALIVLMLFVIAYLDTRNYRGSKFKQLEPINFNLNIVFYSLKLRFGFEKRK